MSNALRLVLRSLRILAVLALMVAMLAPSVFGSSPSVALLPASGRSGTIVTVSGSVFNMGDKSCKITSAPDGLVSNQRCMISNGLPVGSFLVATGANGNYTVTVTGNTGDTGFAPFTVLPAASNPSAPVQSPAPPNQTLYLPAAIATTLIVCITVFVYLKKHRRKVKKTVPIAMPEKTPAAPKPDEAKEDATTAEEKMQKFLNK